MAIAPVWAQQDLQPRQLVEAPTAGLLPSRGLGLDLRFYGSDGILGRVSVGLFNRIMAGVSFGGSDLLGNEAMDLNPRIEFSGRVRVIEEGYTIPALAVGYTSQGYGMFDDALNRYNPPSPRGFMSLPAKISSCFWGTRVSTLAQTEVLKMAMAMRIFSGYVGLDAGIGKYVVMLAEYDFGLNDNADNSLGSGKGFFQTRVSDGRCPGHLLWNSI